MTPTQIKLAALLAFLLGVWLYGKWEHHAGYDECRVVYEAKTEELKKESHDAILAEEQHAESDRGALVDYYNGLLSAGAAVQPVTCKADDTSRVLSRTNWCEPLEDHLRSEEEAAENTAKLLRVRAWGQSLGLKPE